MAAKPDPLNMIMGPLIKNLLDLTSPAKQGIKSTIQYGPESAARLQKYVGVEDLQNLNKKVVNGSVEEQELIGQGVANLLGPDEDPSDLLNFAHRSELSPAKQTPLPRTNDTATKEIDNIISNYSPGQKETIRSEDLINKSNIQEAEVKRQRNLDIDKKNRAETNVREKRGHEGTPNDFTEAKAKEFLASDPDPRLRERLGKLDAYGKPVPDGEYAKSGYSKSYPGRKQNKAVNSALRKNLGLEYTVEQHHLIHLRDSATIGKHLDALNDPITKAAFYDYMLHKFKILPGNFDLNIANIPTGPHRMGVGGDLHTWLDRIGYDDFWLDFEKKLGGRPASITEILDAFDLYIAEVFDPMMIKLDDLVKKNPTKGDFEGAYIPQYLVDEAKARMRRLQETYNPARLRGSEGGIEEAIEGQVEQAYNAGLGDQGANYQEIIDNIAITGRRHYQGPDQKKIKPDVLQKKKEQDIDRGIGARYKP